MVRWSPRRMAKIAACIVKLDVIRNAVAMAGRGTAFSPSSMPGGGHTAAWARTVKYAPNSAAKNTHSEATNRITPSRAGEIGRASCRERGTRVVVDGELKNTYTRH